jgi:hypothetical protein
LILFAGMVWAVFALWNWLMPSLFGLHTITYWQALGLMALSWILFRGFRGPVQGSWRLAAQPAGTLGKDDSGGARGVRQGSEQPVRQNGIARARAEGMRRRRKEPKFRDPDRPRRSTDGTWPPDLA